MDSQQSQNLEVCTSASTLAAPPALELYAGNVASPSPDSPTNSSSGPPSPKEARRIDTSTIEHLDLPTSATALKLPAICSVIKPACACGLNCLNTPFYKTLSVRRNLLGLPSPPFEPRHGDVVEEVYMLTEIEYEKAEKCGCMVYEEPGAPVQENFPVLFDHEEEEEEGLDTEMREE